MSLAFDLAYTFSQFINIAGATISYTAVTTLDDANPAPNPPQLEDVVLSSAFGQGSTSVDMSGNLITGRLIEGDQFQIAGDDTTYTVQAQVISPVTEDTFTGVTISPALAQDEADGAAVTFTSFAATTTGLLALVSDFPAYLINGTSVQSKDHRVRFLADAFSSLPGFSGTPAMGDKITMPDGEVQQVIKISHLEVRGIHYGWALQVRA